MIGSKAIWRQEEGAWPTDNCIQFLLYLNHAFADIKLTHREGSCQNSSRIGGNGETASRAFCKYKK